MNGTPTPTPTPTPTNGDNKLDIGVLNNGVKLVGEALVPGASLLLEKHIGAGLLLGAGGLLGGAALGSVFGPLGYVLARYGASALSFSQSLQPPPKTSNGTVQALLGATANTNNAVANLAQVVQSNRADIQTMMVQRAGLGPQAATQVAPAFAQVAPAPPEPAPKGGLATVDVATALEKINERLDQMEHSSRRGTASKG